MDPLLPGIPSPETAPVVVCEDCHRNLSGHASRLAGRGPVCRRKHGVTTQRRGPAHTVDQDQLPGT